MNNFTLVLIRCVENVGKAFNFSKVCYAADFPVSKIERRSGIELCHRSVMT